MKNFKSATLTIALFVSTVVSHSAYAAITIDSVTGLWQNIQGGSGIVFPSPNEVRWGDTTPNSSKSGYRFDGSAPPLFAVGIDTPFTLGTMTNFNQPIPRGSAITSADLQTTVNLNIDGTQINNLNFTYSFLHNETPNIPDTCVAGSASVCDDIEELLNNTAQSDVFSINGVDYTIKVTGFQIGGQQASQWLTAEGATNNALLRAVITKSIKVPEPGTYLLLASSLLLAAFALRRKKAIA